MSDRLQIRNPDRLGVYHIYRDNGERVGFVWRYMGGPWSTDTEDRWALAIGSWLPENFVAENSFPTRNAALAHLSGLLDEASL